MHADFRFLWLLCSTLVSVSHAFYIPGFSIKSYADGESIPLFVNKIFSDNTQVTYAYSELPFVCPPSGRRHGSALTSGASITLNLGEILRGDRITVSDYELKMGEDDAGHYLCSKKIDRNGLRRAREIIKEGYVAEWIVDNLPGATIFVKTDRSSKYYASGFKMGRMEWDRDAPEPRYYINNHVTLVIKYRLAPGRDGGRGKKVIVGFEVFPKSIEAAGRNETGLPRSFSDLQNGMELSMGPNSTAQAEGEDDPDATLTIPYTYSVYYVEETGLEWANRWDMYFVNQDDNSKIHWLAITNSLIIAGLLTAIVAVIFTRTIRGEIVGPGLDEKGKIKRAKSVRSPRKSNEKTGGGLLDQVGDVEAEADLSGDEETLEDITGWKLVHGDVFRNPQFGGLLAPLVGSGSQLVFVATGLLLLSCLGILNPSFRGGYVSVGITLFVFAGLFSGYFSARLYKTFGGQLWQKNVVVTGVLIPGLLFSIFFILNLFVWAHASSTAIPFGTLVALLCLWLLIQLPLVYVGSWYGYTVVGAWSHPIKPHAIPRQIPQQAWWSKNGIVAILGAGLVPFLVVFIELLFVFQSIWLDKSGYYYVFGFLGVVAAILMVTIVEVSVIATYLQLCSENYHWWWHSFLVGGSSSVWIFMYCVWYYMVKLHINGFMNSLLFFCYSFLACVVYGLLTGTTGFLASYWFVRRIYSAIKVD